MNDTYPNYTSRPVLLRTVKYFLIYIAILAAVAGAIYLIQLAAERWGQDAVGCTFCIAVVLGILWCVANAWAGAHIREEEQAAEERWNKLIKEVTEARPDIMEEIERAGIDLDGIGPRKSK